MIVWRARIPEYDRAGYERDYKAAKHDAALLRRIQAERPELYARIRDGEASPYVGLLALKFGKQRPKAR